MAVDKERLVAYLERRAEHPNLLVHAVLMGLLTAVRRGDFDEEQGQ